MQYVTSEFDELNSRITEFKKEFPKVYTGLVFGLMKSSDYKRITDEFKKKWCIVWISSNNHNDFYDAEGFDKKKEALQLLGAKIIDKEIPIDEIHIFNKGIEMKYEASMVFEIKGRKAVDESIGIDEIKEIMKHFKAINTFVVSDKENKEIEKFHNPGDGFGFRIVGTDANKKEILTDRITKEILIRKTIDALRSETHKVQISKDGNIMKILELKEANNK
ncbi:hypothetical protein M0R19_07670 [Candidatus Pacearchaeota archaeon]|nr:hypothetical protein [Candidatus Pacearchaeota archaeon]